MLKVPRRRVVIALLALTGATRLAFSQEESQVPAKAELKSEIFSGTVKEIAPDSVTVIRNVQGKDAVMRRFSLGSQTRIEGRLKVNARVTVRFEAGGMEDPVRALHIIVR